MNEVILKMKFGKLINIDQVDFSLPTDPIETSQVLQGLPDDGLTPRAYIGCTGWSMKEWVGHTYPPGTKAKDYLKYYAKQFNTIELNTTHYRIPDSATIDKWIKESTDDFMFCPKIPQSISHQVDLGISNGLLLQFCDVIQRLDRKLGCCFMQMPPYFGTDRLWQIEEFLNHFPNHIPLAIEVRHASWFKSPKASKSLFDLLEKRHFASVITDVAGRRDVLHQRITREIAMIRFVGNGLVDSDYQRIDQWVQKLKSWFEQGLNQVFFFTHEPDNLLAPELALYLSQELEKHCKVISRGPTLPYEGEGQQISLF